jgi:hypothetical protein
MVVGLVSGRYLDAKWWWCPHVWLWIELARNKVKERRKKSIHPIQPKLKERIGGLLV